MFNWLNCYLSGRHEFGVRCEPHAIYLSCLHCGRRSSGWSLGGKAKHAPSSSSASRPTSDGAVAAGSVSATRGRVLPFGRAAS